jgi:HEAT repeat protein
MNFSTRGCIPCLFLLIALVCATPAAGRAEEDPIAPRVATLKDKTKTGDERARAATELGGLGPAAAAAIPALIDLMDDDSDRYLRNKVIEALGKIGATAVPALTDAFRRGDKERKRAAAQALGLVGAGAAPAVPCLVESVAPDKPATIRLAVVRALGSIPDDRSVKALADEVLNDPNFAVRHAAVLSLGWLGPQAEDALEPLLDLLHVVNELNRQKKPLPEVSTEKSPETLPSKGELKSGILRAVAAIGTKKVSRIAKLLEDPDPIPRDDALSILAEMGEKAVPAVPAMAACLKDADADMRSHAASALGYLGRHAKSAVPALEKCFRDPSADVRIDAAGACLRIDPKHPAAMATLSQSLKDPDWNIRFNAMLVIHGSRVKSEQAVKAVSESCADGDVHVRIAAVRCLGSMVASQPLALRALEASLKDESAEVRVDAVRAVANARDLSRVIPALVRSLEDSDAGVRCSAASALGDLERAAASAIPALKKHLNDEDKSVRKEVADALEQIKDDLKSSEKDKGKKK